MTQMSDLERAIKHHGCEYCTDKSWERKPLSRWETSFNNWTFEACELSIEEYSGENFLSASPSHAGPFIEISFCPMCGRYLADLQRKEARHEE